MNQFVKNARRRTLIAGGAAMLAIGYFLGQFGMPGLGPAKTTSDISPDVQAAAKATTATIASAQDNAEDGGAGEEDRRENSLAEYGEEPVTAEQPPELFADGVLTVVIEDRRYLMRYADGITLAPVTLNELVAQAHAAPGDVDGMKLRILRRGSARATTEFALRERLATAGLMDATTWQQPLVP